MKEKIPLFGLCLGFFMVILDATAINVAIPSIGRDLGSPLAGLQWVIASYSLAFACSLLQAGYLTDRFGAKRLLLIGLLLFITSSLACGLAQSLLCLIIYRLIQGLAGALLLPASLSLINAMYSDQRARAKAVGIWGGLGGIAAASGPVLGALLTTTLGWQAVFFINIPIGLISLLLVIKSVREIKHQPKAPFDILGQTLAIVTLAALMYLLIKPNHAHSLPVNLALFSIFILSLLAFILIEQHSKSPMLPLSFFKSKSFSIAIISGILLNIGLYGTLFILPIYFEKIRHLNVLQTGFAILPLLILVAVSSYLAGQLASRSGLKLPLRLGFLIGMLGFISFCLINQLTTSYYPLMIPLAAIGFGAAFTMPAATLLAVQAVPSEQTGLASGAFSAARQFGSLLGIAIFGSIRMDILMAIASLLFFIGFLLTYFVHRPTCQ